MSPFISESRRRRRRPTGRFTPVVVVSVVLALVFAMPAFGGPSALSIAKLALKNANKALKASKKKVGASRIVNGAVISAKIANGAVGTVKITNGAVTNAKLAPNSVGNANIVDNSVGFAKLIDSSVNSAKVVDNSVSLADLVGADATVPITLPAGVNAHTCAFQTKTVAGAVAGQVPLLAVQTTLPDTWVVTALKVPSNGNVVVRFCNIDNAASVLLNATLRIITFG